MSARPYSETEYHTLAKYFTDQGRTRDHLMLVLGCSTGYRIQELLSLTFAQVWDGTDVAREITIARRDLKGGKGARRKSVRSRRVPLSETVRAAIRDHLAVIGVDDPQRAIFATARSEGGGMNQSQAYRTLVTASEACGIDVTRISTHSLRKTFVGRVYAASGNDLIKTQRIVGHSSPLITARYLETDSDDLDRLVLQLAA
jgi:integrase